MRVTRMLAVLIMLALVATACQNDDNPVLETPDEQTQPEGEVDQVIVPMEALNDSGQTGEAVLTPENGQTRVVVTLQNSPAGPQPIHIHPGTCEELDPKPAYPLENMVNGTSESLVDVSLETLLADDFAINVHKSPEEAATYVSCGQIAS